MRDKKTLTAVVAIVTVSLVVLGRQVVTHGVFSCLRDDTLFYLSWSRQMAESLSSGVWYPRWMAESHSGYGNPTFIFYSPLTVYLTAVFKVITGDLITAAMVVKLLGLTLSGLFMFMFIKDIWGPRAGLVAAIVYMAEPFRVFDIYFLGIHASKFAYVWFPLILFYTRRAVLEEKAGTGTAGLAVSYGLLCLTHILSAYMFLPVLVAFGLFCAGRGGLKRAMARLAVAGSLSFALSAFYLVPVLAERSLVHFEMLLKDEIYHYWNNYLFFILKPISPFNPLFYRYLARTVVTSAALGVSVYLLSRPSRKEARGPLPAFFLGVVIFTLFIMTSMSGFLWANVPGMTQIQFPTRWAAILVFGSACLSGAGAGFMDRNKSSLRTRAGAWLTIFIISAAACAYYDIEIITRGCYFTPVDLAKLPDAQDVREYVPRNVSLEWLRYHSSEGNYAKIIAQYPENIVTLDIKKWAPERREFEIVTSSEARLRVRTFYYPGWQAVINGSRADISAEPVTGAMLINVPKGRSMVTLAFMDTPLRWAAKICSALAWIGVIIIYAGAFYSTRKRKLTV